MTGPLTIREAGEGDLPGIFGIYNHEIAASTSTFEFDQKGPDEQRAWFGQFDRARYPVFVAELGGRIAGWSRVSPWSPRPGYARTAEDSVYVHRDARSRGVGRGLLGACIAHAKGAGFRVLVARINEDSPASIRLHQRAGFTLVGVMRGIGEKFGRVIDVRIMTLDLRSDRRAG